MSYLMQLDKQIQSIKKTKKITHAMRLIAMSLYARIAKIQKSAKEYQKKYHALLNLISENDPDWKNPITFVNDPFNKRPLIILISSIKGLCGGFNENILSYFDRFIETSQYQTPLFIAIGRRANSHLEQFIKKTARGSIIRSYPEISSHSIDETINDLTQVILQLSPRYSSMIIYSTKFQNFFNQRPTYTTIVKTHEQQKDRRITSHKQTEQQDDATDIIWEHSARDILNIMGASFLQSTITPLIIDSLVAEQSARFLAMEHATSNAEKYIEKLELQYNKLRQESITKELSEITSIMTKSSE